MLITNKVFGLKDTHFDANVFTAIRPWISDTNTGIMVFFSFLASRNFLFPANIALIIYFLWLRKHKWYSIKVPVVAIGSFILMSSLKLFFSRPRPLGPVYEAARGFSYPSGHAMSAMTFYGLLIYIVWQHVNNKALKGVLIFLLLMLTFSIGFSRVYLRVHYASDVIAGFSMGIIWLVLSLAALHQIEKITKKRTGPEMEVEHT